VQPTGVADIQNAVTFARERDMLLAVKCGGHSSSGKSTCEGGMQIDLSTFRNARVDPGSRTAFIAGGSLLGELDRESMAFGLVSPSGTVSHTGVGGLTLGGGFGRVARKYGLALDNVNALDIVTADSKFHHASAQQNPDLYWALRGGGNFGVVTGFEFALHPMQRQVIGGEIVFPLDRARSILTAFSELVMSAPDDLYIDGYMSRTMTGEGDGMHVCYSCPAKDFEKVMAPIRKLGKPAFESIAPINYVDIQRSWDNTDSRNVGLYQKGGFINEFPGELVGLRSMPQRLHIANQQPTCCCSSIGRRITTRHRMSTISAATGRLLRHSRTGIARTTDRMKQRKCSTRTIRATSHAFDSLRRHTIRPTCSD